MRFLSCGRRKEIKNQIEKSHQGDGFVDELLFTQFCDKSDILRKGFQHPESKSIFKRKLKAIQKVRDNVAHANVYASSREHAENVCKVVGKLLALRKKLPHIERRDLKAS